MNYLKENTLTKILESLHLLKNITEKINKMENITHLLKAVKYTTILENGIIRIPQFEKYKKQEVEIFIILKPSKIEETKQQSISDFLDKWTGYFSEVETDDFRYNYLMEKYK